MNVEAVKAFLAENGKAHAYREFPVSSATVELAAQAVGCEAGRIAKSLTFVTKQGPLIVVAMGTARIDNRKFKDQFGEKANFAKPEELVELVGHPMGGVCPFVLKDGVRVCLDDSLKQFDPVWPAAGATNNAVCLSLDELQRLTHGTWVNVCKDVEPAA